MRSGVAYVILGALQAGPRSGYEVKQLVDKATRFFWAASYGQIYPELRRLREEGLIAGVDDGESGRRRVRYELTEAGRGALVEWLRAPITRYELRDEGLLKLFFADALEPADALALVRSFKAQRRAGLEQLRAIEADPAKAPSGFHAVVLGYGLEFYEHEVAWAERLEARLMEATKEGVER
jgi:PadR family transcriptional regulator, regulatory protein AphA